MSTSSFATHWYLHIPSLLLVAMIYLLIMRGAVALALGWSSTNPFARALAAVTLPAMALAAGLTPRSVPRAGVWFFAIVWTFAALGVVVYVLAALGRRPLWM
jgi:hypothetical protein